MLVNEDTELADLRRRLEQLTKTCEALIIALETSVSLTINQKALVLDVSRMQLVRHGAQRGATK